MGEHQRFARTTAAIARLHVPAGTQLAPVKETTALGHAKPVWVSDNPANLPFKFQLHVEF